MNWKTLPDCKCYLLLVSGRALESCSASTHFFLSSSALSFTICFSAQRNILAGLQSLQPVWVYLHLLQPNCWSKPKMFSTGTLPFFFFLPVSSGWLMSGGGASGGGNGGFSLSASFASAFLASTVSAAWCKAFSFSTASCQDLSFWLSSAAVCHVD